MTTHEPEMAESFQQLDLSGKLIIKMQLGDDIRRIPIHNEDITYDELVLMMERVFRGRLNNSDEVTIKYKDEDGDLVTISDSSELSFAIQCSRILRLTLFVNGSLKPMENDEVKYIRQELQSVRDQVIKILDSLDLKSSNGGDEMSNYNAIDTSDSSTMVAKPIVPITIKSKEFDPLSEPQSDDLVQSTNNVLSSFGLSNETDAASIARPPSPTESVDSIESSRSNKMQPPVQAVQPNISENHNSPVPPHQIPPRMHPTNSSPPQIPESQSAQTNPQYVQAFRQSPQQSGQFNPSYPHAQFPSQQQISSQAQSQPKPAQPPQAQMHPSQAQMQPTQTQMQPSQTQMQPPSSQIHPTQSQMQPTQSQMQPTQSQIQPSQAQMQPAQVPVQHQNANLQSHGGFMQSTGAGQGASHPSQLQNYYQPAGGASQPPSNAPPSSSSQPPVGSTASGPPPQNIQGFPQMQGYPPNSGNPAFMSSQPPNYAYGYSNSNNPYSRSPAFNQYPRPQAGYPQTNYQ